MTSRDLLQQRTTLSSGDTSWRVSPLITAAREGRLAVLDGLHRVDTGTLTVLKRYTSVHPGWYELLHCSNELISAWISCNIFSQVNSFGPSGVFLPARTSEQGNVIGLVSVYIYIYIYICVQFFSELGI